MSPLLIEGPKKDARGGARHDLPLPKSMLVLTAMIMLIMKLTESTLEHLCKLGAEIFLHGVRMAHAAKLDMVI